MHDEYYRFLNEQPPYVEHCFFFAILQLFAYAPLMKMSSDPVFRIAMANGPDDLRARVEEAKEAGRKSFLMLIRRQGDPRFVALALE